MSSRTRATTLILSLTLLVGAGLGPAGADDALPSDAVELMDAAELEAVRDRVGELVRAQADEVSGTGAVQGTDHPWVDRISGPDRYATAAALSTFWSEVVWPEVFTQQVVLVASGESFPDALSGGPLATMLTGPILLTQKNALPAPTKEALTQLRPGLILVLGGTGAISAGVQAELEQFVTHPSLVSRIDGGDRYEVSAKIANHWDGAGRVYVASGEAWPDGLAGGAAAGAHHQGVPLLLTKPGDVPTRVMEVLRKLRPYEIVVVGGPGSVGDAAVKELQTVAPVQRVSGTDRYATAAGVARDGINYHGATMASGLNWPDALAGSAFAGLTGDKLLLLRPTGVPGATSKAVTDLDLGWITVLGGVKSVPEPVLDQLRMLEVEVPSVR